MNKNYVLATSFFIFSLFLSVLCDAISKILIQEFGAVNISVFRAFFSGIIIVPVIFFKKVKYNYKNNLFLHILRSVLFFPAMFFWLYALKTSSINHATISNFCIPLVVLIFSSIFLKEKIQARIWLATILIFLGLILSFNLNFSLHQDNRILYFVISIVFFALLDIITKKISITEEIVSIIIKSSICNTILCIPFLGELKLIINSGFLHWFIVLGAINNLLFYFLIKAYSIATLSFLAPLRYIELIIAMFCSYIFWGEYPKYTLIIGFAIIAATNIFVLRIKH